MQFICHRKCWNTCYYCVYLQLGVCSSIFRWAIHQKFIHSDENHQKKQKLGNRYMCHLNCAEHTQCHHVHTLMFDFWRYIISHFGNCMTFFTNFLYFVCDYPEFWTKIKLKSKPFGADLFFNRTDSVPRRISIIKKTMESFFSIQANWFRFMSREKVSHCVYTVCTLLKHAHSCKIAVTFCVIMSSVCVCVLVWVCVYAVCVVFS